MLPFMEVAHLPSSASFYSAVTQPLGVRYLTTSEDGPFASVVYGDRQGRPLFELRQVAARRERPLKPSYIEISAGSAEAADDAYECALRATPESRERSRQLSYTSSASSASHPGNASASRSISSCGKTRVTVTDFDANIMEVVYRPPSEYSSYHGGPTLRHTQSTQREATRILDWNYGVVTSEPPSSGKSSASGRTAGRRPYHSHADDEPYSSLKRSVTDGPTGYEPLPSPRQNSTGLSAGTVVGTLLGVAAAGAALGGALTYSKVMADRSRAPRQEFEPPRLSRRSTVPDPYPERKTRYVDVERTVEKVRHPEDYAPAADYRPAPDYIARYNPGDGSRSRVVEDAEYEEMRGRHSSSRSRASVRPRSEAASNRAPLLLAADADHRSQASSSRSSRHPPIVQRSYTYEAPEGESFVSARSRRSSATIRGPPPPGQSVPLVSRSRSSSRMTVTTHTASRGPGEREYDGTYVSARGVPLPPSTYMAAREVPLPRSGVGSSHSRMTVTTHRANRSPDDRDYDGTYISARGVPLPPSTYMAAREVPLPRSGVGSSHRGWDDDDADADSVAPSDSISCVGGRRSGRAYH